MEYIGGADRNQMILFPESIEDYISEENSIRVIDAYIESLDLKDLGFEKYKPNFTGRPMYSPKDMLKLYVYGYMNRTRSSRRLETETKRNLEVMWLLGKLSPDHKTIARFRKDNAKALKNVFKDFVGLCTKLNLYGKELIAIDGSKFKAVNSKDRNFTQGKLKDRIKNIENKIENYFKQLDELDTEENQAENSFSPDEIKDIILKLNSRREQYQGYQNELIETGEKQKSLTDPDSKLMKLHDGLEVCYNVQMAVDSKNKMVVDFDVTNQPQDKNQLFKLANSVKEEFRVDTINVIADAGYDSATDIAKCVSNQITPHISNINDDNYEICIEVDERNAEPITSYENGRCVYLKDRNVAICPMGKILYPSTYKSKKGMAVFRGGQVCHACTNKCTTERCKKFEITISKNEFSKEFDDSNLFIKKIKIERDRELLKQRKCIVEHPFGILKRHMNMDYLLLKGKENVSGEFSLAYLAFNLKRAIKILGTKKLIRAVQM